MLEVLEQPVVREAVKESHAGMSSRTSKTDALEDMHDSFLPDKLRWSNIDWPVILWILAMHLGCLAAPFYFSWTALGAAAALYLLTGCIGICLGFHRYHSHQGFTLAKPVQFVVNLIGTLATQGPPLTWIATHRLHHAKSDKPGDPHSPRDGAFWSHMLWLFTWKSPKQTEALYRKYVPDLMNDPMLRFFGKTMILWNAALAAALYWFGGLPALVWGMCVRMTFVYHSTWFVNSATHMFGYRNYETRDDSSNVWWVALLATGEGWHNNHHAYPRLARHGHRWFELDPTWWAIRMLAAVGLASNVADKVPPPDKRNTSYPGDDPDLCVPSADSTAEHHAA